MICAASPQLRRRVRTRSQVPGGRVCSDGHSLLASGRPHRCLDLLPRASRLRPSRLFLVSPPPTIAQDSLSLVLQVQGSGGGEVVSALPRSPSVHLPTDGLHPLPWLRMALRIFPPPLSRKPLPSPPELFKDCAVCDRTGRGRRLTVS